jgi:hypothetical protein
MSAPPANQLDEQLPVERLGKADRHAWRRSTGVLEIEAFGTLST